MSSILGLKNPPKEGHVQIKKPESHLGSRYIYIYLYICTLLNYNMENSAINKLYFHTVSSETFWPKMLVAFWPEIL